MEVLLDVATFLNRVALGTLALEKLCALLCGSCRNINLWPIFAMDGGRNGNCLLCKSS